MSQELSTRPIEDLWFDVGGYTVRRMTAGEAGELPDGFRAVYGDDYLSEKVYDAATLAETVASGDQVSYLARDPKGRLAGHIALARSAPNRALWEMGQAIVLPDHRKAGIFRWLFQAALSHATRDPGCVGVFATSLTNHVVSQKVCSEAGFADVGLEIDYVPRRMLLKEGARGAIATIVQYLPVQEAAPQAAHVPMGYRDWAARLLTAVGERGAVQVSPGDGRFTRGASGLETIDLPRFDMSRLTLAHAGGDFAERIRAEEEVAEAAGRRTVQVLLPLGRPDGAAAFAYLRRRGYGFSGVLPHFLADGGHAGMLYRSFDQPNLGEIQVYSPRAQVLLSDVRADWAARVEPAMAAA
ncbi:GNAT family N-acetyltransferase [Rhodovibrio salinarum]|uniref:N-acetyltransferase n=1 Tax=Rhodovibrio salinarum TaxID=1087 RepID=A0A934QI09_9PROT|nr:GNAT family N-acetyltransferase [Rhodovibrio salinarum]MBK1697132.1 N-acetyltransferase [Rhodovibrio salinarum]